MSLINQLKNRLQYFFLSIPQSQEKGKFTHVNSLCSRLTFQSVLESVSIFQGYRDFESVYINTDN